jgi:outer membrane biosynthesis protein TonB
VAPDGEAARAGGLAPIERIPPVFPREAARAGVIRGSVRARAIVGANGNVERVEFPGLDANARVFERSARAAVMTWTFPPGERGRVYDTTLEFVAP